MKKKLTKIVLFMVVFPAIAVFGFEMAKVYYTAQENDKQHQFKVYGQYAPKYIGYTDDQMLKTCEKYDLIYEFEKGICE